MSGLLLSFGCFLLLIVISIILLRLYRGTKRVRPLVAAYGVALAIYGIFYPSSRVGAEFWNGILVLTLAFQGYANVVNTTVFTGFAAHLLALVAERKVLTFEQALCLYREKGGLDKVLSWRLAHLCGGKYLKKMGESYRLLPKGRRVAKSVQFLKELLRVGEGG